MPETKTEDPRQGTAPAKKAAEKPLPINQTQIGEDGKRRAIPKDVAETPLPTGFLSDAGLGSNGPADQQSDKYNPKGGGPKAVTQEEVLAAQAKDK